MLFFFFFFQAEDGIRDLTVTGVQTCALPISTIFTESYKNTSAVITARSTISSSNSGAALTGGFPASVLDQVQRLPDVAAAAGSITDTAKLVRRNGSTFTTHGAPAIAVSYQPHEERFNPLGFGGVALFVGAFVIFNTISITVAQRMRELATLRTIGASRRQVMLSVLGEALIVGALGALTGLFLGFGLAVGLDKLMAAIGI